MNYRQTCKMFCANNDRTDVAVTYSGGGLPFASHFKVTLGSRGSAMTLEGGLEIMVGGCSTVIQGQKHTETFDCNIYD